MPFVGRRGAEAMDKFWLKAAGDNAYADKEQEKEVRSELVKRLKQDVRQALVLFSSRDGEDVPVADTIALVATVEACFVWGWRETREAGRIGGGSYFAFVREGMRGAADVAREVAEKAEKSTAEKTELGKGRWFVLSALKSKCLAYCVHRLHDNAALCSRFYDNTSLWLGEEGGTVAALLVSLNGVSFAAGPLLTSLDEKSALANVLEEVRGGKQEGGWGPFGFIKSKKKKKPKKSSSKKSVVDLSSPVKNLASSLEMDDEARQMGAAAPPSEEAAEEPEERQMRQLEQIMGEATPPSLRPPLMFGAAAAASTALFLDDEPGAVLLEAGVVATTSSDEHFEEDQKDELRAQSVSPARAARSSSVLLREEQPASGTPSTYDSVSGALFLPEPALRSKPKANTELMELFAVVEEEQVEPEEEQEDKKVKSSNGGPKGKEEEEQGENEQQSEFARQLMELENERLRLEEEQERRRATPAKTAAAERVVVRERPRQAVTREAVVVADAGDLFLLALALTPELTATAAVAATSPERGKERTVVRQLSSARNEPAVPTVSIRHLPLHLLSEPSVMTATAQKRICADCLQAVVQGPMRFCNLFGRWFCTSCHRDDESVLPGRVLRLWDFKRHKVCLYAKREIARSASSVLYDLQDLNPGLFNVSETLLLARNLRRQLALVTQFVAACPDAGSEVQDVLAARGMTHLVESATTFSLHDLRLASSGRLVVLLRDMGLVYLEHVANCGSCAARRVPCITCRGLVFDFDVRKVSRCSRCGLVCHRACLTKERCLQCRSKR